MSHQLPELPEPCATAFVQGIMGSEYRSLKKDYEPDCAMYSPNQMRAYAEQAIASVKREPLSDDKLRYLYRNHYSKLGGYIDFASAIEQAHGIGVRVNIEESDKNQPEPRFSEGEQGCAEFPQWLPIESAPKDVLVMVYSPPQSGDWPDEVRITFDYIDTEISDDHWYHHGEHYEHYCCVAKPEGSTRPSEKAPYTHWMPLPAPPITASKEDGNGK